MLPSLSDDRPSPPAWSPSPARRLVRHRGVYWTVALVLALVAGITVHRQASEARRLVDRLGTTVDVVRVESELAPGDPIHPVAVDVAVPAGLAPAHAVRDLGADTVAARRVAAGAVLTEFDIGAAEAPGPEEAAMAVPASISMPPTAPGRAVVLVLAGDPFAGLAARLVDARVIEVLDDRVVVAVGRADLADVAAALSAGGLAVASG
ncbi:MAG: hypothetical protein AAF480_16945 [Actinomycetota bacterium]